MSGFSKLKRQLDAIVGPIPAWSFHDFRRTIATMMGDIGIEPHIVEEILGHVSYKQGVAGLYNRARYTAQKQDAMEKWAAHVEMIVTGGKRGSPWRATSAPQIARSRPVVG